MHENREISSTPWSDDQGRSAKATSRTVDMYVPEKSDCVVVPVNQPNKGGQPSAEAGEGRAQTRENIAQSHMHPTQSGKRMSQGLDGVRKAAKERKQERFTASGETIATVSDTGTEAHLLDVVSHAGEQLRRKLGIGVVTATEAVAVKAALPSNSGATRLYSEGLARLRVFDALAARDALSKAVAADPNFALAHSALAEVWS